MDIMTTVAGDVVDELAQRAGGAAAAWEWLPVDHRLENITTERLGRLRITLTSGVTTTAFVKWLRPASRSPHWQQIPEQFRPQVLVELDHRTEPTVYSSPLAARLPAPLRMPELLALTEIADPETIVLWLEDVPDSGNWDLPRYRRTAEALGRFSASFDAPALAGFGLVERDLRGLFFGKICNADLPLLRDEAFWASPVVREAAGPTLRADLEWLADVMPRRLEHLRAMPQVALHGDAAPANFHEPGDGSVVGLDWSYAAWAAPGSDLSQLLVGRLEAGVAPPEDAPAIAETIVAGYLDGAAALGATWTTPMVEEAFATTLAVRSMFSALIVEPRPDLDEAARAELTIRRGQVAQWAMELCRRTSTDRELAGC
jgi:hypothetical protein